MVSLEQTDKFTFGWAPITKIVDVFFIHSYALVESIIQRGQYSYLPVGTKKAWSSTPDNYTAASQGGGRLLRPRAESYVRCPTDFFECL